MNSGKNIVINENTRIKDLLNANQEEVIAALVKLNKNFSRLKNPLLRNLFARRVTIVDACKIAGCSVADFMNSLQQIGFKTDSSDETGQQAEAVKPEFKGVNMEELDVRPVLSENKDPLKEILDKIKTLKEGQGLKLINTFEPIPLIHLLAEKGFSHYTEFPGQDTVITYFLKNTIETSDPTAFELSEKADSEDSFDRKLKQFSSGRVTYIDVRELEMPKPMLLILENIDRLAPGEALFVYHKKRPVFLIPELEKRELEYFFKDTSAGDVNMLICKL